MRKWVVVLGLLCVCGVVFGDWIPPRRSPHRRKGGEAMPPLPLPATPLRRTEKKRPPSPPTLIVRLIHGGVRKVVHNGREYRFWDWNTNPGAIKNLLRFAFKDLGIRHRQQILSLARLECDPNRYPIVLITGHLPLKFSDAEIKKMREFAEKGGYLWFEACCGNKTFWQSAIKVVKKMFPHRRILRLPPEHPLFHSHYSITTCEYNFAGKRVKRNEVPEVYGVDIGCRTAVFLFRHGITNGWDGFHDPGAYDFEFSTARKLGVNLVAYCLAYFKLGLFIASSRIYPQQKTPDEGAFVFAQLRFAGNWDTNPTAAINLLQEVQKETPAVARFKRVSLDPEKDDITKYPFLFICGHDDFSFSKKAVEKLRNHLLSGGFLVGDACCARRAFTNSFVNLVKQLFPNAKLKPLPPDHPIYNARFKIASVSYLGKAGKLPPLPLYGVDVNGVTRIIFCPYALSNGWEKEEHPFTVMVAPEDALKLGVNIITYCLTH